MTTSPSAATFSSPDVPIASGISRSFICRNSTIMPDPYITACIPMTTVGTAKRAAPAPAGPSSHRPTAGNHKTEE